MTDPKQLIDAYIDGTLDDAGFAELCGWLREDDANRRAFTRALSLHSGIADWVGDRSGGLLMPELSGPGRDAREDSSWIEALSELDDTHGEARPIDLTQELNARRLSKMEADRSNAHRSASHQSRPDTGRKALYPLAAAVFALAAMIGLAFWIGSDRVVESDPADGYAAQPPPTDSRDQAGTPAAPVATVTDAFQPVWHTPDSERPAPSVDGRMTPGRYTLTSGAVELKLDYGAVLLVEAPAKFEIVDKHTSRLIVGRLTADTRTALGGFRLETPTALAQGLAAGGRFGVAVDDQGRTSARVFAGQMDFSNLSPNGQPSTVRLGPDEGAVVSRAQAAPKVEPVTTEQFALEMASLSGKPVVTGQADYHNHMPPSVVMNRGPQSPRAWVALESTGRPLVRGTAWAQGYPERPRMLTHPEGRVVDSYLVMFDPADETGRFKTAEFTLTFPGEVLTVITEDADLIASHAWYGSDEVQYSYQGRAIDGLEGEAGANPQPEFRPDQIEMSEDRRTMRVFLGAHNGADVFRVLVVRPARAGGVPAGVVPEISCFTDVFRRGGVRPAFHAFSPVVGVEPVRGTSAAMSSLKGEI